MTALYIILGIIFFFVLILSIPVFVDIEYTDVFRLSVRWLFIKIKLYPNDKPKKEKPKKEKPEKTDEGEEEKPEEKKPKEKKENLFTVFYKNQGVPGIVELIKNCAAILGKFSGAFLKSIVIKKLRINISVTESDAAATAIRYGKICSEIYPPLGFICSSCTVKDYKVNIYADYLGDKTHGEFSSYIGLIPRKLINAGVAFVFRLAGQLLKVVFSNIKYANKQASGSQPVAKKPVNKNSNMKGGQTQ